MFNIAIRIGLQNKIYFRSFGLPQPESNFHNLLVWKKQEETVLVSDGIDRETSGSAENEFDEYKNYEGQPPNTKYKLLKKLLKKCKLVLSFSLIQTFYRIFSNVAIYFYCIILNGFSCC